MKFLCNGHLSDLWSSCAMGTCVALLHRNIAGTPCFWLMKGLGLLQNFEGHNSQQHAWLRIYWELKEEQVYLIMGCRTWKKNLPFIKLQIKCTLWSIFKRLLWWYTNFRWDGLNRLLKEIKWNKGEWNKEAKMMALQIVCTGQGMIRHCADTL